MLTRYRQLLASMGPAPPWRRWL